MFTCNKKADRIIFTRDEDNKSIIFNNDGTIIGLSGKTLKNKPRNMGQYTFIAIMNCKLEDSLAFCNTYYTSNLLSLSQDCSEEKASIIERVFKIVVRQNYERNLCTVNDIAKAFNCACRIAYLIYDENFFTEKEAIRFIQDTHITQGDVYSLRRQFIHRYVINNFWNTLPPIEYPKIVKNVCNYLLEEQYVQTDEEKRALKSAVTNSLIVNLYSVFYEYHQSPDPAYNKISHMFKKYFKICRVTKETPNLNGNFITKYAEALRKYENSKSRIFADNQNERDLTFENDSFFIIVPQTVAELIQEGKEQHNCVGNWDYDKRIMEGKCNIVFVRHKEAPQESYITCEIGKDGDIKQYLLSYNEAPSENSELDFRAQYQAYLKSIW